jgi:hypothetical protein
MFDIRHIFLDLDSVDRKSPDPATTHVSDPRPGVHDAFVSFMEFYLIDLKAGKNPFILGSALLTTPQTVFRDAAGQSTQVPDLLKPAGVSFSLFHDPDYPGRSCLCYALVTRGGHQTVSGSPPNLIANPIKKDGIDGVIAFSHAVFLEPVILEPVYLQIRDKVRAQVQQTLTLDDSEYGGGFPSVLTKQPYGTWEPPHVFSWLDGPQPLKWSYPVASASHDDDRYGNSYTVTVVPSGSAEQLQFSGSIYVFKQHTTSLGFLGKAQAWASATIQWSSTVTIGVADSGTGVEIKATTTPMWQQSSRHSGHNVGASLVDIANAIANLCTGIANPASLPNIFSDMFEHPVSGIGSVGVAVGALGAVVGTSFVMPAGSVFSARNPQIDAMGNYQLELTVRPSIQGALS